MSAFSTGGKNLKEERPSINYYLLQMTRVEIVRTIDKMLAERGGPLPERAVQCTELCVCVLFSSFVEPTSGSDGA